ncbi:WD40 repeat-like protein [Serendipita vermifera]|nr:WD40 repeat-like protein [Serendipita vermifera]
MYALDRSLITFQLSARQLDSSVGSLASAGQLRNHLMNIGVLFQRNAAEIFPQMKSKLAKIEPPKPRKKRPKPRARIYSRASILKPTTINVIPEPETLPSELSEFATNLGVFLRQLEEFPEFADDTLTTSITALETELKRRAESLAEYRHQLHWPTVQRYVHAISAELVSPLQTMNQALEDFVNNGIPAIRFAQKNSWNYLVNLSVTATFFSGVTATTAQYSLDRTATALDDMVNLLFFGSLVLSVSTAINSLLGLTWKQAIFRSPRHRVPWWILIWIKRSPLVFMIISVALFSAGLVCFCYTTQSQLVSVTVLLLTCFSTFGLLAVSAWFMGERWTYKQHNGMKWLSDVLHGYWDSFVKPIRTSFLLCIPRQAIARCQAFGRRLTSRLNRNRESGDGLTGLDSGDTPLSPTEYRHGKSASELERGDMIDSPMAQPSHFSEAGVSHSVPKLSISAASIAVPHSDSQHTLNEQAPATNAAPEPPKLTGVGRLRQLAWKVAEKETLQVPKTQTNSRGSAVLYTMHTIVGRLTTLRPALKRLEVTHTILRSSGLVRHLQFSPNGKQLATCAWDGTARLFNVPQSADDDVGKHLVMNVYTGFLGQVAWSPNGNWLITRWANGMAIWSENGIRRKNIPRRRHVHTVTWFPNRQAFLSVEGSQISELDLDGNVTEVYELQSLDIHTVAITPDEERMICVGVPKAQGSTQPSTSRVEKRLVVYNLKGKCIENSVPTLDDVQAITISRYGHFALVSSENKGYPQLFQLEEYREFGARAIRLLPFRTYVPRGEVDFAGPSYFAGRHQEFIFASTKSGDILFWDRETGLLLHTLKTRSMVGSDMTSMAWNFASDKHMFASSSHDGCVRIWMSSPPECTPTRDKPPETQGTHLGVFNSDIKKGISNTSLRTVRQMTTDTDAAFTLVGSSPKLDSRPSLDSSVETHGTSTVHESPTQESSDSLPLPPPDFHLNKGKDPDLRPAE